MTRDIQMPVEQARKNILSYMDTVYHEVFYRTIDMKSVQDNFKKAISEAEDMVSFLQKHIDKEIDNASK